MSDAFFNTSKTIANDFLQSVVFIDDRAFIVEKEANIKNKLSRGKFSAAFMIQCLTVIGVDQLRI